MIKSFGINNPSLNKLGNIASSSFSWASWWARRSLFFSAEIDYDTNLWLDDSGNENNLTLVSGNCINVINDITITLFDVKIGATVTKVNESAATAGVTINGSGNIAIDQSELPNAKIWTIELSTGEIFYFTSGIADLVLGTTNAGHIIGTEDTDWEWSTTDSYHGNLKRGYNKYLLTTPTNVHYWGDNIATPTTSRWTITWKGAVFKNQATNNYIFGISCKLVATSSDGDLQLIIGSYGGASYPLAYTIIDGSFWGKVIEIELSFDGVDYTAISSLSLKINGVSKTLTAGGTIANSGFNLGSNTAGASTYLLTETFSVDSYFGIYDLVKYGNLINNIARPAMYDNKELTIMAPALSALVDVAGQLLQALPSTNFHNGAETCVKFPDDVSIKALDWDNFLYDGAGDANAIQVNTLQSDHGDKHLLFINNSNRFELKNLVFLKSAYTINSFFNPLEDYSIGTLIFRDDRISDGTYPTMTNWYNSLDANGIKGTRVITGSALEIFGDTGFDQKHIDEFAGGHEFELHAFPQTFWVFSTYQDGKNYYDNAFLKGFTEGMGTISESITVATIEQLQANSGLAYFGADPDPDDDNRLWWEWVIQASLKIMRDQGMDLLGVSTLGSIGNGVKGYDYELWQLLKQYFYYYAGVGYSPIRSFIDVEDEEDDIDNDVNPFIGTNLSIVTVADSKWVKFSGAGGTSYGSLKLEDINKAYNTSKEIRFTVNAINTGGSYLPFKTIVIAGTTITFNEGGNITLGTQAQANSLAVDINYVLKFLIDGSWLEFSITDESGADIYHFTTQRAYSVFSRNALIITADGNDILIKDIKIRYLPLLEIKEVAESSYQGYYTGYETLTWKEYMDTVYIPNYVLGTLIKGKSLEAYWHEVAHDGTKPETGLDAIQYYYSLDALDYLIAWGKANNIPMYKPTAAIERVTNSGRVNLIPNFRFRKGLYGTESVVNYISGYNLNEICTLSDIEIAPDKSSGVLVVPDGEYTTTTLYPNTYGKHLVRITAKGIGGIDYRINGATIYKLALSSADYKIYEFIIDIPISARLIQSYINGTTDFYVCLLSLEKVADNNVWTTTPNIPSGLTLTQIPVGIQIDWTDTNDSSAQTEIWGKSNDAEYALIHTIGYGTTTKNDAISSVVLRSYKIRSLRNGLYSEFIETSIAMDMEIITVSDFSDDTFWLNVGTASRGEKTFSSDSVGDGVKIVAALGKVVSGRNYRCVLNATFTGAALNIRNFANNQTYLTVSNSYNNTFDFTANGDGFFIRLGTASKTFTYTVLSLKEI